MPYAWRSRKLNTNNHGQELMSKQIHPTTHYLYLGDRITDSKWKGKVCKAVRRPDHKCIRGRNGGMLVRFGDQKVVVLARLLRKTIPVLKDR
jgi:hypothetical protein